MAPLSKPARHLLVGLTVTNLGLLLTWSLLVPTFRAPDEHVHHDLLRQLTTTWRYPDYDGLRVSRRTLDALGTSPAFPADAGAVSEDQATPRAERPGWDELGPAVRNGPPNQMPQHPPLYYEAAAAVLRVLDDDGSRPLDRVVWELRLLSVLVTAPLPLLAAAVARRFSRSEAVVLAAAATTLAVPQLTHIGSTVSNDPLMVALGSLTLLGAAHLATGDRRWSVAAGTGVTAGLALFTKGFAIPLVPAVALACLLPLRPRRSVRLDSANRVPASAPDPSRESAAETAAKSAVVAVLALAFGGWWWIRNVVVYGTPQPGVRLRDRVAGVDLDLLEFAEDFAERLITSFWGNFGWFEARLPYGLSIALTSLLVASAVAACWRRWERLVLLLPAAVATGMVLSAAWGAYKKTGVSYATQGRYLFTGIVGLAVLSALGIARWARRGSRWQPAITVVAALGLQATALWIVLHRYWAGGSVLDRVRSMAAFAPVPGAVTAAVLVATALSSLAVVSLGVGMVRTAHAEAPDRQR